MTPVTVVRVGVLLTELRERLAGVEGEPARPDPTDQAPPRRETARGGETGK